jgi:hypothetical protein
MMCLEQNIWVIMDARNIEQLIGDVICPRELTSSDMEQPQSRKRRRQVDGTCKLSRQRRKLIRATPLSEDPQ